MAKNRLHIDVRVSRDVSPERRADVIAAKVAELTAAGATTLWRNGEAVVMADPEGNEFCVC